MVHNKHDSVNVLADWKYSKYTKTPTVREIVKYLLCLATVHVDSYEINIIPISAEQLVYGYSKILHSTNQRNTVKILLTPHPAKIKTNT